MLLTGPLERIPSSSRNSSLQRTIEQLLEVEVPQRIARMSTLLSSVSWRVSTGLRLLVRSVIVEHPAWNTRADKRQQIVSVHITYCFNAKEGDNDVKLFSHPEAQRYCV